MNAALVEIGRLLDALPDTELAYTNRLTQDTRTLIHTVLGVVSLFLPAMPATWVAKQLESVLQLRHSELRKFSKRHYSVARKGHTVSARRNAVKKLIERATDESKESKLSQDLERIYARLAKHKGCTQSGIDALTTYLNKQFQSQAKATQNMGKVEKQRQDAQDAKERKINQEIQYDLAIQSVVKSCANVTLADAEADTTKLQDSINTLERNLYHLRMLLHYQDA